MPAFMVARQQGTLKMGNHFSHMVNPPCGKGGELVLCERQYSSAGHISPVAGSQDVNNKVK